MNAEIRYPLYARLPEIYRIRDAEQVPPGQLAAYLGAVEHMLGAIHESIGALYDDHFIDTCDDWVVPYLADLLGTTHLKGEARTLRADVADTIALRRRKGTLGAIERLAANLTGWPCRAVELFPNLAWAQHLNHQRPDDGGRAPYGAPGMTRFTPRRGGTVPVRDPAMLSLTGTAFDPFAYTPDVRRADDGTRHVNLPNLAIWVWRLAAYRLPATRPHLTGVADLGSPPAGSDRARFAVRMDIDALDRPVRLFNTYQRPQPGPGGTHSLTAPDAVGAPILPARLDSGSEAGNPAAYVRVDGFTETPAGPKGLDTGDVGLQLYVPEGVLDGVNWRIRGENLCAWEDGLDADLAAFDLAIDPVIGRMCVGVATQAQLDLMVTDDAPRVYIGYTYGAIGPIGAHPVSRAHPTGGGTLTVVDGLDPALPSLQDALADLQTATGPVIVEIRDSLVHELDPATLPGALAEDGTVAVRLVHPLVIRAASGARPVIRLAAPLAFRPLDPTAGTTADLAVDLNGLYVTGGLGLVADEPLIARAAVARLRVEGCTLDPGGHLQRDGSRAPMRAAMLLAAGYGFADAQEEDDFTPTPEVTVVRSVVGRLGLDDGYLLRLQDSVVDAGDGPGDRPEHEPAIGPASGGADYGAVTSVRGVTILGRVLVLEARGSGAVFSQRLDVWNHQVGCLRHCWFSGDGDRLPPHYACVSAPGAPVVLTSAHHGQPGYVQPARGTAFEVTDRGPGDDAMGATGFLLEAHKRANLGIRLREFMPVGIRPLVLPLT
ncbi:MULTISPECIES: phage tail protein [Citricoccus]|uniref:phage tail protein n=1 Tax=Citricoccus TaxID=169133 RepID=UPI000255F131|nr:phage tail protein [Citricoccus sp. CH26A]